MNHLYEIATGRLVSSSALNIDPPVGMAVVSLPDGDEQGVWSEQTISFDYRPVVNIVSKDEFLDRLTFTEQVTIVQAAKADAGLQAFVDILNLRGRVTLSSPDVIAAINGLESSGLLGIGRAGEILNG